MRALEPEVVDAVWQAVETLLPSPPIDEHPLGCHRSRVPDRMCFEGILIRLVTGCAWVDVEQLLDGAVSDTTLRGRRDEWLAAGVFDALAAEALAAYDRIIGLDFSECAVDGSQHKAPTGGEGTGPNPFDRGKRGWKWSLFADRNGIPIGWAAMAPTATTPCCSNQRGPRSTTTGYSPSAKPCTWTAATTTASSGASSQTSASMT